jgi:hypothetical protein
MKATIARVENDDFFEMEPLEESLESSDEAVFLEGEMSDEEFAVLEEMLVRGCEDVKAGRVRPAHEVMADLRARFQ